VSKIIFFVLLLFSIFHLWGKDLETVDIKIENSIKGQKVVIEIIPGEGWIHKKPYNQPPQFAIWIENEKGEFLETIYVTKKTAKQGWRFSGGSRRKESLPVWGHSRGIKYGDSLYLPTKKEPLPDGITSQTPRAGSRIYAELPAGKKIIFIFVEINHSVDWNSFYPENSEKNGQPSVVYSAAVNTENLFKGEKYLLKPIGTGSPDGGRGGVFDKIKTLTSALDIVKSISLKKINSNGE